MSDDITRPIIGIENRSAREVFDIMCDRFRAAAKVRANSEGDGEAVAKAYVRGVEWRDENPGHVDYAYRFKAACDYADKMTSPIPATGGEKDDTEASLNGGRDNG